jgi:signal transduction histidine kinase
VKLAPVTLDDAVAAVVPMIEPQRRAKELALDVRPAPGISAIADREKLEQILINLLSNAVKFTAPGGTICVYIHPFRDARDAWVGVTVEDTGIGIPADRHESVFEPFVQLHRELAVPTHGTGLGLAISRELARAMGGDLRLESEDARGSRFTIVLRADGSR